ncbi:hypothetical protein [uncultured Megasphaera sp.]|uniref:hypothetical protein n=1 Tax=uncultured Megasphaera sp. TaxID=165188 RepID=UPI0025D456B8|nr:hypothetical protein [uncultured Megasphaera sp.]
MDYKLDDVFGLTRDVPLTYVEREEVDERFRKNLSRNKHITIYGSSKQGKTCLKKHCLKSTEYINIQCSNKMTLTDINTSILKMAGYELNLSNKKTISGKTKVLASAGINLGFIKPEINGNHEKGEETVQETKPLELDPDDVNDIIEALKNIQFNKYIILDDFHYLKTEVQKDFAIELKAFHENSKLCFIVIGVWLDENKLITYNGDLTGRVISVNADLWPKDSLKEVIHKGEALLNIKFSNEFVDELVSRCFDNVYYVQEVCHRVCELKDIRERQDVEKRIECDKKTIHSLINEVVNESAGRYRSFITQYSTGFQDTSLQMHKWLLYPILTASASDLSKGLSYRKIRDSLEHHHPKGAELNRGNLTQALKSVVSLQLSKHIQPIIMDYDETNLTLHIVDRGFIIWLQLSKKEDLLELADFPAD